MVRVASGIYTGLVLLGLASIVLALSPSEPVKPLEKFMRCRACAMITKEVQRQIKLLSEDKDKTFQVGHRMQRNQNWQKDDKRKRKYYGSEVMAMDVLERVCSSVEGRGHILATQHAEKNLNGRTVTSSDGRVVGEGMKAFCQTLLEEYEEELKEKMFQPSKGKQSWARWLCVEETSTCKEDDYLEIWAETDEAAGDDDADEGTKDEV